MPKTVQISHGICQKHKVEMIEQIRSKLAIKPLT